MGLAGQLEYSLALLSRDGRSVTAQRPGVRPTTPTNTQSMKVHFHLWMGFDVDGFGWTPSIGLLRWLNCDLGQTAGEEAGLSRRGGGIRPRRFVLVSCALS